MLTPRSALRRAFGDVHSAPVVVHQDLDAAAEALHAHGDVARAGVPRLAVDEPAERRRMKARAGRCLDRNSLHDERGGRAPAICSPQAAKFRVLARRATSARYTMPKMPPPRIQSRESPSSNVQRPGLSHRTCRPM